MVTDATLIEPPTAPRPGVLVLEPKPRPETARVPHVKARPQRLVSLDAFRGLAVLGMLLVNNKALGLWTPEQLTHGGWSGSIHLADLVYPWFLLIVGVSIPFSWRSGLSRWGRFLKVLQRATTLVLLGCLVNSSYAKRPMFDLGVLQLIGFAYFGGALLYAIPIRWQMGTAAGLLVAHWALLRFFPIPGFPAGLLTEGRNAVVYLNQVYLERYGLENLPAALPTIALVLIGTGIGDLLRTESVAARGKVRMMLLGGTVMVGVGWLWSLDLPLSKPLWTSPYILVTAGWGAVVLSMLYHITDVRGRRALAFPLVVLGMNAITAFVLPILVNIHVLNEWGWTLSSGKLLPLGSAWFGLFARPFGLGLGGLLYTLSYLLVWWLVLYWMYRRRVFVKV